MQIHPAPLVITAHQYQRFLGEENPILTGDISGLIATDQITLSFSTIADRNSAVGVYPISTTIEDPLGRLNNYSVSINAGILEVLGQGGTNSDGMTSGGNRCGMGSLAALLLAGFLFISLLHNRFTT
jgi:hypothetical protein